MSISPATGPHEFEMISGRPEADGAAPPESDISVDSVVTLTAAILCKMKAASYRQMGSAVLGAFQQAFLQIGQVFAATRVNAGEIVGLKKRLIVIAFNSSTVLIVTAVALALFSSLAKAIIVGGLGVLLRQAVLGEMGKNYRDLEQDCAYAVRGYCAWKKFV